MNENVSISGSGRISGGQYKKISVSGSAKITEAAQCESLHISGSCRAEERLETGLARISGALKCDSDLTGGDLSVSGALNVGGRIKCGTLKVDGSLNAVDIDAQECILNGYFKVTGSVNSEVFKARLAAGEIGALYGETVEIESKKSINSNFFGILSFELKGIKVNGSGKLTVNEIEATNISLSGVKAFRVSGDKVTVDSDCEIDTLEYISELNIPRDAKVKRIIKI